MKNKKVFCSWSGGKDACLALYRAHQEGYDVDLLFTTFIGTGEHSRAHGLKKDIIEAQAKSLGIDFEIGFADWGKYGPVLRDFIAKSKASDITGGVFGDIDLEEHKLWIEDITDDMEFISIFPLWKRNRVELVEEFISLGFETIIISTKTDLMGDKYLGRTLDKSLVKELIDLGIDPSGEGGEFHTLVIDGPIFKERILLDIGQKIERGKYHFLEVELKK